MNNSVKDNSRETFLFTGTVLSYLIALLSYVWGWYITGPHGVALILCLPLVILLPAIFKKRRRYYQLIPNLLVVYIGWSLIERFINPEMKIFAGLAVFSWTVCLILMLKLIRTPFLVDGGHYIPDHERKRKRQQKKLEKAQRKANK